MKWNIVTDSSCDLFPMSRSEGELQISSVPFIISVGDRDFIDDETLDLPTLLTAMEHPRCASHTACPSPNAWLEEFMKADNIIAITISSQLSASMNSAVIARDLALKEDPQKKIALLDSCSTGPELVLCVRELERLIQSGADFDSIVLSAKDYLAKARVLFALCSFHNLVKNGRMNKMAGFVARALNMWGIGSGSDEGRIVIEGKTRGAGRALELLLSKMEEKGFSGSRAAISHCANLPLAEKLKDRILDRWPHAEVTLLPTRGLCSYYAERGGLILSFETPGKS